MNFKVCEFSYQSRQYFSSKTLITPKLKSKRILLWLQKLREKGEDVFEACWQSILFSSSVGLEADISVKRFLCISVRSVVDPKVPVQQRFWVDFVLCTERLQSVSFQKPSATNMAGRKLMLCQLEYVDLGFLMSICSCVDVASLCLCSVTLSQYYIFDMHSTPIRKWFSLMPICAWTTQEITSGKSFERGKKMYK